MDEHTPVVAPDRAPPDTINRFPIPVSVRFDEPTLERLDALARERNRSRNAEIRAALRAWLSMSGAVAP